MFIQCLSWFITRYCYHIGTYDLAARNAAGKGQGCPPASRHFCQATICSAGARCRASTYNCSSTHLQYFACFSLFFIVFPYFYKSPKFSLCHDSMSQAQKENERKCEKQREIIRKSWDIRGDGIEVVTTWWPVGPKAGRKSLHMSVHELAQGWEAQTHPASAGRPVAQGSLARDAQIRKTITTCPPNKHFNIF